MIPSFAYRASMAYQWRSRGQPGMALPGVALLEAGSTAWDDASIDIPARSQCSRIFFTSSTRRSQSVPSRSWSVSIAASVRHPLRASACRPSSVQRLATASWSRRSCRDYGMPQRLGHGFQNLAHEANSKGKRPAPPSAAPMPRADVHPSLDRLCYPGHEGEIRKPRAPLSPSCE